MPWPKNHFLFLFLLLAPSCILQGAGDEASKESLDERLFSSTALAEFFVELEAAELDKLGRNPKKYVRGNVRFDGRLYKDVGVRLKGHRSFRTLEQKAALKLRFDKFEPEQRFLGRRRITLNNMAEDPTLVAESLGYEFMRSLNVAAPKTGYAEVFVNGQPYGLYLILETVDEDFLESRFGRPTGVLYEGEFGCDLYSEDVQGFDEDEGDDPARTELHRLIQAVETQGAQLVVPGTQALDGPAFLGYLAVSQVIGDFDGYRHGHNYRIYFEPGRGQWMFIPWGIDRVFRRSLDIYDSGGRLARLCFDDHACRVAYLLVLQNVAEQLEVFDFTGKMLALSDLVREASYRDPRRSHGPLETLEARGELQEFVRERPSQIRAQTACLEGGQELDYDKDGFGCMDCDDQDPLVYPGQTELCDGIDNNCSGLVDDAPRCGCPLVRAGGDDFYLCDLPMSWPEAEIFCAAQGLTLARVSSAEQSSQLVRLAQQMNQDRWWIGLSDRTDEGSFRWVDGSDASFLGWSSGEPDNAGCNQDCVALKEDGGGEWQDTHCVQHRPFICRAPTSD